MNLLKSLFSLFRLQLSVCLLVAICALFLSCGNEDPEPPAPTVVAQFTSDTRIVKQGEQVDFTDQSTGDPTSWQWAFASGTPSSSSEQNISVTYNDIGEWDVSLGVSNGSSNDELIKEGMITVRGEGAFYEPFFTGSTRTDDIVYGVDTETSLMNIFEPFGDTREQRPAILLLGGGGFQGSDLSLLDPLTEQLVSWGYVVAQVRYINFTDNAEKTFVLGQQDSKAAVRYFRKEAANLKVDPDRIFIGGNGTGAFLALYHAYVDEDELSATALENTNGYGGLEGDRGNPGFSSEVSGVISLAGGFYNNDLGPVKGADFIESGDVPVFAVHGFLDDEVPYDTEQGVEFNTYGSKPVTERAESQDVLTFLYTFPNGDHDTPRERPSDYIDELAAFLREIVL